MFSHLSVFFAVSYCRFFVAYKLLSILVIFRMFFGIFSHHNAMSDFFVAMFYSFWDRMWMGIGLKFNR